MHPTFSFPTRLLTAGGLGMLLLACQAQPCGVACSAVSVPADSKRVISAPLAMAAVQAAGTGLGPSITLGSEIEQPAALYLRFPACGAASLSWLVLEPRDSTYLEQPLTLEVGRARGPFESGRLTESKQPGMTTPIVRHGLNAGATGPIRIDVSELIQYFRTYARGEPSLVVRAQSAHGRGLSVATGLDGGRSPRLDCYSRE